MKKYFYSFAGGLITHLLFAFVPFIFTGDSFVIKGYLSADTFLKLFLASIPYLLVSIIACMIIVDKCIANARKNDFMKLGAANALGFYLPLAVFLWILAGTLSHIQIG